MPDGGKNLLGRLPRKSTPGGSPGQESEVTMRRTGHGMAEGVELRSSGGDRRPNHFADAAAAEDKRFNSSYVKTI